MKKQIRILLVENISSDITLISGILDKAFIHYETLVSTTREAFLAGLTDFQPDIILCSDTLPSFNFYNALDCLHKAGAKIPFILFTSLTSEEFALEAINKGADDYIVKDRLERLPAAILNVLEKYRLEQEREDMIHNHEHLAAIVNASNDGIISKKLDGTITSWNPGAEKLFGYTAKEAIGKNITMLIPEERLHEEKTSIDSIKRGEPVQHFETVRLTKNGKKLYVSLTISPLKDSKGTITGAAKIVHDISGRKKLEELLNKTNHLARIGSWEVDLVKNTFYMSDITREIHEVDKDYIPDMNTAVNFYQVGPHRDAIANAVKETINTGTPYDLQLQITTAKGNERWIRTIGSAEFAEGECVKLMGSFQDIDTSKRSELEILKVYEEKDSILESIGDAFYAADKNWIITYWNKEAEKLLGMPKNQILGKNLWHVFPDRVGSDSYNQYHHAVSTNTMVNIETYNPRFCKWFEIAAFPSLNGLSVFFRDITERKRSQTMLSEMNESLHKAARELEVSNAELEQFAFVASHDLQEPLRMITSFLTLIEKKYSAIIDDKGREYISFAVDGSKRMRQIILDLLEFSRVGKSDDKEELIDLNELTNEILTLHCKQIEDTKAIIKIDKLPQVLSFKTPMRQVFQNLINNGIKYHRDNVAPEISVSVSCMDQYWKFAVADNGIGIAGAYADKIFVIFQRLHNKETYSGTGIGLAITKKIIERLGGKIWVESEETKGSVFYFTLPK